MSQQPDTLNQLKQLLLEQEQQRLQALERRLDDPQLRGDELAALLPSALRKANASNERLAQALQQPVQQCLHGAIHKEPHTFADALFPVMGPAIRRSIIETLRGMVQSINQVLDQSFSLRGIAWRFESLRSGVPFHQIVLRHTLLYRVEQLFLIHRESGLLIQHLGADPVNEQDPDAVSAMLTAIQDFAKDSFSKGSPDETLDSVDIGEQTLWLCHGPHAVLAAVIHGLPPADLRERLEQALEQVHAEFSPQLLHFEGDRDRLGGVVELLEPCLLSEQRDEEKKRLSPLLILLALALAAGIGWSGYTAYQESQRIRALVELLQSQPGLLVLDRSKQDGKLVIEGLRDPLAADLSPLLTRAGYRVDEVAFNWKPYQSSDPKLTLARATQLLQPPEGVTLSLQEGRLVARGEAEPAWIERASLLSSTLPNITGFEPPTAIEKPKVVPPPPLLVRLQPLLQTPDGASVTLKGKRLEISGSASIQWLRGVEQRLAEVEEISDIDSHGFLPLEQTQLQQARWGLDQVRILFASGSGKVVEDDPALTNALDLMQRISTLASQLEQQASFVVVGHTDASGDFLVNQRLSTRRALSVARWLNGRGISEDQLSIDRDLSAPLSNKDEARMRQQRRGDFRVRITRVGEQEMKP